MSEENRDRNQIYVELLKEFNKNRIDYNVRKWETVKFFEAIFTGFTVAATGAIIGALKLQVINDPLVRVGIAVLPFCSIVALVSGILDLRRESRSLFVEEATVIKIMKLLPLPSEIEEDKRWIPGDKYLLPKKYRDYTFGTKDLDRKATFDQWLKSRLKNHKFLQIFTSLFLIEIAISLFLIIFVTCLN